jgi:hypothetical protein
MPNQPDPQIIQVNISSEEKPESATQSSKPQDRRRSERIEFKNPLVVTWLREDGVRVHEYGGAVDASMHGCQLRMTTPVPKGAEVEIRHPRTQQSVRGTVMRVGKPNIRGEIKVGVNLHTPGLNFWLIAALDDDGHPPSPVDLKKEHW